MLAYLSYYSPSTRQLGRPLVRSFARSLLGSFAFCFCHFKRECQLPGPSPRFACTRTACAYHLSCILLLFLLLVSWRSACVCAYPMGLCSNRASIYTVCVFACGRFPFQFYSRSIMLNGPGHMNIFGFLLACIAAAVVFQHSRPSLP